MREFGLGMLRLLGDLSTAGVDRAVAMIRHGAREFVPGRHDLENSLTDAGRASAHAFGTRLPSGYQVRGYASPVERCKETATLALAGYEALGGATTRVRPMEGLGVFYTLDQMKMYRIMQAAGGLGEFVEQWVGGAIGADVMLDADLAARAIARLLQQKLQQKQQQQSLDKQPATASSLAADRTSVTRALDLLVSHDMTLALLRHQLLGQHWGAIGPVAFLDGIVVYAQQGEVWIASPHGEPRVLLV